MAAAGREALIHIAGIALSVADFGGALLWPEACHLRPYRARWQSPAAVRLRLRSGERPPLRGCGVRVSRNGPVCFGRGDFELKLWRQEGRAAATCSATAAALDSVFRLLMSELLPGAGGLVVHAASVAVGCRGLLFVGPSGAGKSTLVRLLGGRARALSDEVSLLRRNAVGRPALYPSPFWGELRAPLGEPGPPVPLAAVCFLRHGAGTAARRIPRREALFRLCREVLRAGPDRAAVEEVLREALGVVSDVPCFDLGFRPDGSAWEEVASGTLWAT